MDDVPLVFSEPADTPSSFRCVLPFARPVTVWLLDSLMSLFTLSRRVTVPVTDTVLTTVFVVVSIFDCGLPPASVYLNVGVMVRPPRVCFPHVTRPVLLENAHDPSRKKSKRPNPRNGPPSPPMKPMPKPGPRPKDQRPPGPPGPRPSKSGWNGPSVSAAAKLLFRSEKPE